MQTSPSSAFDERKRKRKLSNRESARRCGMRKQQRMDELIGEVSWIQEENKKLSQKIEAATQLHLNIASNNNVVRAQLAELTDRLRSLNYVLQIASEASGLVVEIPDSLPEPWQLPCPIQSVDMFHC